ncbi:hypothetical protein [Hydrogenophaga aquatica]
MNWYEEQHHKLSMAIARLEATQRRIELNRRSSTVTEELRRVALLPALHQADQGSQSEEVTV